MGRIKLLRNAPMPSRSTFLWTLRLLDSLTPLIPCIDRRQCISGRLSCIYLPLPPKYIPHNISVIRFSSLWSRTGHSALRTAYCVRVQSTRHRAQGTRLHRPSLQYEGERFLVFLLSHAVGRTVETDSRRHHQPSNVGYRRCTHALGLFLRSHGIPLTVSDARHLASLSRPAGHRGQTGGRTRSYPDHEGPDPPNVDFRVSGTTV